MTLSKEYRVGERFKEHKELNLADLVLSSRFLTKLLVSCGSKIGWMIRTIFAMHMQILTRTDQKYTQLIQWIELFARSPDLSENSTLASPIDADQLIDFLFLTFEMIYDSELGFFGVYQPVCRSVYVQSIRNPDTNIVSESVENNLCWEIDFDNLKTTLPRGLTAGQLVSAWFLNRWLLQMVPTRNPSVTKELIVKNKFRVYPAFLVFKFLNAPARFSLNVAENVVFTDPANHYDKVYLTEFALCTIVKQTKQFARGVRINHYQATKLNPDEYAINSIILKRVI